MKKILFILALFCCTAALKAESWEIGYPNAADVIATLNDSTLTISGTGEMMNWTDYDPAPWSYRKSTVLIIIKDGVTSIGTYAFSFTKLISIEIPNSVTYIGGSAFRGCSALTSIEIPNSVDSIRESAFSGCSALTSFEIPNNVTYIGGSAFWGCSALSSIEIPNSVTYIGDHAFRECSALSSIEIPNSVTYIEGSAFRECSALSSITIPNTVTSIGAGAFEGCSKIKTIINLATSPQYLDYVDKVFYGVNYGETFLYVPANSVERYRNSSVWRDFQIKAYAEVPVSSFSLNKSSINIKSGESDTLLAIILPSDASLQNTVWKSSDYNIAVVNEKGVVTGVSGGKATITASTEDGEFSDSCEVNVALNDLAQLYASIAALEAKNQDLSDSILTLNLLIEEQIDYIDELSDSIAGLRQQLEDCENKGSTTTSAMELGKIEVYPNPVHKELRINKYEWQNGDVVELYDMIGNRIYSAASKSTANEDWVIDMSPYPAGNYLLRIGHRVAKVVKR